MVQVNRNAVQNMIDLRTLVDVPVRDGGGDEVEPTADERQRAVENVRSALNRWAYAADSASQA